MSEPSQREFDDKDREEHGQHQRPEDPFQYAPETRVRMGLIVRVVCH